jgi:hypothetical protein
MTVNVVWMREDISVKLTGDMAWNTFIAARTDNRVDRPYETFHESCFEIRTNLDSSSIRPRGCIFFEE